MDILVYTRNGRIADLRPHLEARFTGVNERVMWRNASAHTPGDVELADIVLVDDDFPQVAEDYRDATFDAPRQPSVELFRASEVGHEPPEAQPPAGLDPDLFASPTAYDTAVEAGITPDQLAGVEPQGATGYTTAQMRQMAG